MKEKQAAIAEKNSRKQQVQEETSVPQRAKKVMRRPSPEPQVNPNPQPFRSNSPPLPAVLKKMKEKGIEYIPPRNGPLPTSKSSHSLRNSVQRNAEASQEMRSSRSSLVINENPFQNQTAEIVAAKPPSHVHSRAPSNSSRIRESDENGNRQLLEQLEAIQRELQNEDAKVLQDIENASYRAVQEYEKHQFETTLDDINMEINGEIQPRKLQPSLEPKKVPLPPRQTKTTQFQRYRDLVTPKSVSHTPPPYDDGSRRQLDTESQLIDITRNMKT
jgi:hypothetical protein